MTEGLLKLKSTKYLRQTIKFDNVSDTDNIAYDMSTLNQSMDEINATVESDKTGIEGVESPSAFIYVLNVKLGDKVNFECYFSCILFVLCINFVFFNFSEISQIYDK